MNRQKDLIGQIRKAVDNKKAPSKFKAGDFDCLKKSKPFLWKHSDANENNNGNFTVFFTQISRGLYKLRDTKNS